MDEVNPRPEGQSGRWIWEGAVSSAGLRLRRPWFIQKNEAPKIQLGGLGQLTGSPSGVWAEPQPKSNLV